MYDLLSPVLITFLLLPLRSRVTLSLVVYLRLVGTLGLCLLSALVALLSGMLLVS